ncbi:hypothetical protein TWF481_006640 [Arthrobotrys musiformis]|uniref:Uncharacterized protein n=1 Tax=Arthrobotrys musiformis TaxID=47236 RepID=A0AAV9WB28_9PEZI
MAAQKGQYVVYAFPGVNELVFARVTKERRNLIEIELRSENRITLTVDNDPDRIQVLPNSVTPIAEEALNCDEIEEILKKMEIALDVGATVTAAAAPGLFGGAAIMSGLATIGGTAVGGIIVVAGTPAALAGNALRAAMKQCENNADTRRAVNISMVAGGVAGGVAAVGSVAASGSVFGLSAAGITSGLAGLGGGSLAAGGMGMVGGLMACSAIVTVPVLGIGLLTWGLVGESNERQLQRRYNSFCQRWHDQGYQGP